MTNLRSGTDRVTVAGSPLHVVEAGDPEAARSCSYTAGRNPGIAGGRS